MMTITLKGHITEDGKLEVELPDGLPPGDVEVVLQMAQTAGDGDETAMNDVATWTDEVRDSILRPDPKSGAEIVRSDAIGLWSDYGITDSAQFVEQLRRSEERRRWQQEE